jgi:hypothetical protein
MLAAERAMLQGALRRSLHGSSMRHRAMTPVSQRARDVAARGKAPFHP